MKNKIRQLFESRMEAVLPLVKPVGKIGVAVSGGGDSMVLLFLTVEWARAHKISVSAITVDHMLRKESADEAEMVAGWCLKNNVDHVISRWIDNKGPGNLQQRARYARIDAINRWRGDIPVVLIGHSMSDQAETVLMRLIRGSGVDGISGIAPISKIDPVIDGDDADVPMGGGAGDFSNGSHDLFFARPLIDMTREEIRIFARQEKIVWADDPGNENTHYKRVFVRKAIRDIGISENTLAMTARRLARASSALEEMTSSLYDVSVQNDDSGMVLDIDSYSTAHEEIRLRLLRRIVREVSGKNHPPRENSVERLDASLLAKKSFTLSCCMFKVHRGKVFVGKEGHLD